MGFNHFQLRVELERMPFMACLPACFAPGNGILIGLLGKGKQGIS
jgi:hypothetical protein